MTRPRPALLCGLALPLVAAVAGCTTDPAAVPVAPVRVAQQASDVAQCRYVSNFRVAPGAYGLFKKKAVELARDRILKDAAASGADTVVFEDQAAGGIVTEIVAAAYACGRPQG